MFLLNPIEDIIREHTINGQSMLHLLGETSKTPISLTLSILLDAMENLLKNDILYHFNSQEIISFPEDDICFDRFVEIDHTKIRSKIEFNDVTMLLSLTNGRIMLLDVFFGKLWEFMQKRISIRVLLIKISRLFVNQLHSSEEIIDFIHHMHAQSFLKVTGLHKSTPIDQSIEVSYSPYFLKLAQHIERTKVIENFRIQHFSLVCRMRSQLRMQFSLYHLLRIRL